METQLGIRPCFIINVSGQFKSRVKYQDTWEICMHPLLEGNLPIYYGRAGSRIAALLPAILKHSWIHK